MWKKPYLNFVNDIHVLSTQNHSDLTENICDQCQNALKAMNLKLVFSKAI